MKDANNAGKIYQVRFDNQGKLLCSCNMLSSRGFPCRHLWKVNCYLEKNDLSLIPIVPRWTKEYGSQFQRALAIAKTIDEDPKKLDVSDDDEKLNRSYKYLMITANKVKEKPTRLPDISQINPKKRSAKGPFTLPSDIKLPRLRSQVSQLTYSKF